MYDIYIILCILQGSERTLRKWRRSFTALFIKAPGWLSCKTYFAAEEIQKVQEAWVDWRNGCSMKSSTLRSQSLSSIYSIDEPDSSIIMHTTPAPTENPIAPVTFSKDRTLSQVEDDLFRSQDSQKRTSYQSSTITLKRTERYVTLESKALVGDTMVRIEVIPTEFAHLKDSWKYATTKVRIFLDTDGQQMETLNHLKKDLIHLITNQQDYKKTTGPSR